MHASSYGFGAVLSHGLQDGGEKLISFASRSLTASENNYSQIEKEGLACVFGVKRIHAYLYGDHFTLCTVNKALLTLFNEHHRSVLSQTSSRIQCWALTLSIYECFKSTSEVGNVDAMNRLPLPDEPLETPIPTEIVLVLDQLKDTPVTAAGVKRITKKDTFLSRVLQFTLSV